MAEAHRRELAEVKLDMLVRDDGVRERELTSRIEQLEQRPLASEPAAGADRRQTQEADACLSSDQVAFQAMRIANAVSHALNRTLPQIHAMQVQITDLEDQLRQHGAWTSGWTSNDGLTVPTRAPGGYTGARPATDGGINHCYYSEYVDERRQHLP